MMPPGWVIGHRDQLSAGANVCQSVQPKPPGRQEATAGSDSEQDGDRRLGDNISRCGVHPVTTPAISSACPPLHTAHSSGIPKTSRLLLLLC
jgi:hypothetical protein